MIRKFTQETKTRQKSAYPTATTV